MKAVFTFLVGFLTVLPAFAYDEGALSISFAGKSDLQIIIDGRSYYPTDNALMIREIRSGNHNIRVYKARKTNARGRNDRNDLLYTANVQVRPSYHVDIMINRFGKVLVDERLMRSDSRWDEEDYVDNNGSYGNNNNRPMSESEFNQMLQYIKGQWMNRKMDAARDGIARNYLTTSQVRQLLQLFSLESEKLDLAKWAYRNTIDQRNYYQLSDVFSFQSSRDELDKYTREYR